MHIVLVALWKAFGLFHQFKRDFFAPSVPSFRLEKKVYEIFISERVCVLALSNAFNAVN